MSKKICVLLLIAITTLLTSISSNAETLTYDDVVFDGQGEIIIQAKISARSDNPAVGHLIINGDKVKIEKRGIVSSSSEWVSLKNGGTSCGSQGLIGKQYLCVSVRSGELGLSNDPDKNWSYASILKGGLITLPFGSEVYIKIGEDGNGYISSGKKNVRLWTRKTPITNNQPLRQAEGPGIALIFSNRDNLHNKISLITGARNLLSKYYIFAIESETMRKIIYDSCIANSVDECDIEDFIYKKMKGKVNVTNLSSLGPAVEIKKLIDKKTDAYYSMDITLTKESSTTLVPEFTTVQKKQFPILVSVKKYAAYIGYEDYLTDASIRTRAVATAVLSVFVNADIYRTDTMEVVDRIVLQNKYRAPNPSEIQIETPFLGIGNSSIVKDTRKEAISGLIDAFLKDLTAKFADYDYARLITPAATPVKSEQVEDKQTTDPFTKLRQLHGLYESGVITKEEFEAKKKEILDRIK